MVIIVIGNPVDGFTFYGPFDSDEDAMVWAERNTALGDWWLARVEAPEA